MSHVKVLKAALTHYPDAELPWQARLIGDDQLLVIVSTETESDARKLLLAALYVVCPDGMPERVEWNTRGAP